jgi:hypothetical protein
MRSTMTIQPPAGERTTADETSVPLGLGLSASPWFVTAICGALVVVIVAGLGLLDHPYYNDENFYNRLIRYYAGQNALTPMHDSANQPISLGPSFFLAHRLWSGAFGSGETQSRAFSLTLMLIASAFWTSIALRLYKEAPPTLIAAFWFLPFHAVFATCTLAEPFMLAFLLASLRLWMSAVDRRSLQPAYSAPILFCISGLLFGMAINCKAPLLPIAITLVLFGALRLRSIWVVIGPLIAILVQIPFWISWGNILPPGLRQGMMPQFAHLSGIFPDTVIHLLTVSGTVLWPAVRFERRSAWAWVSLAAGLGIWFAFGPHLAPTDETRYRFAGPLLQASYLGPLARWSLIVPFLAAWLVFMDSIRLIVSGNIDPCRQAFLASVVVSVAVFARSPLGFDRYVICFVPIWWVSFWPEIKRYPIALALWFVPLAIQAGMLLEKTMNPEVIFESPLPHLAGF